MPNLSNVVWLIAGVLLIIALAIFIAANVSISG